MASSTPLSAGETGGDGSSVTAVALKQSRGIAVDPANDIYIGEYQRLRRMQALIAPAAPTNVTAVVGSTVTARGSLPATVSWPAPTDTGGVPLTSYVVTPYLGTVAQTPMVVSGSPPATTATFDGLPHGTYTFTVAAANYGATSSPSAPSSAVQVFSVPGQPSNVKAVQNPDGAQISWTAPMDDGGKSITSYAVETGNGSFVASTTGATSVLVTSGLVDGQGYSFVVGASNAVGAGPNSLPSPVFYPFTGGSYHPLQPIRIMDTRDGTGGYARAPLGPNSYTTVQLTRCGCLPASGVSAVVLNVTVTNTTAASFLTVYPAGVSPRPDVSNLNWTAGRTVPNLVEVAVGTGGQVIAYNLRGQTDLVIDVEGYVGIESNSQGRDGLFNALSPIRLLDTRDGTGPAGVVRPLGGGGVLHLKVTDIGGVPLSGVSAVVLNVTVTNPTLSSFLTVYPDQTGRPTASNLNFVAGQTVPNRVIVKVGANGVVDIYNLRGSVDVIADLNGWFTDPSSMVGGSYYVAVAPYRLLDTRDGIGPIPQDSGLMVTLTGQGVDQVRALAMNVTVANPTAPSFLTVWPDLDPLPNASDLNFVAGLVVPNFVVVEIPSNISFDIYNFQGSTDVIVDVVGYYGPAVPAPTSQALRASAQRKSFAPAAGPGPASRAS